MAATTHLLIWSARVAAFALVVFLSLFALDAFNGEGSPGSKMVDFLQHLVPSFVCLAVVLIGWERERFASLIFAGLAVFYAWWAWGHVAWIISISGALLLVSILYLIAWYRRRSIDNRVTTHGIE